MPNLFNIAKAFEDKQKRGWDTLYVLIDLHGTLIKPCHDRIEFYPNAIEVMKWFNSRSDFKTILWTSSYPSEIENFCKECDKEGIVINFINGNSAEKNSPKALFDSKFYFNILLENKAGFVGATDWALIKEELIRIREWNKKDY